LGKGKKIGIGFGIAILGFFILVAIAGTSSTVKESIQTVDPDEITGINKFTVYRDGSMYIAYFRLVDENSAKVRSDATVELKLYRESGFLTTKYTEEYSDTFQIKAEDFRGWKFGQETDYYPTYHWQIPIEPITGSNGFGQARITVTLSNGQLFSAVNDFFD